MYSSFNFYLFVEMKNVPSLTGILTLLLLSIQLSNFFVVRHHYAYLDCQMQTSQLLSFIMKTLSRNSTLDPKPSVVIPILSKVCSIFCNRCDKWFSIPLPKSGWVVFLRNLDFSYRSRSPPSTSWCNP